MNEEPQNSRKNKNTVHKYNKIFKFCPSLVLSNVAKNEDVMNMNIILALKKKNKNSFASNFAETAKIVSILDLSLYIYLITFLYLKKRHCPIQFKLIEPFLNKK